MRFVNRALMSLATLAMVVLVTGCGPSQSIRHEHVTTVNSADASPIVYGVRGQGDIAVVFIHCWTCNHEFWRPQIEAFSNDYRVIWLDLAGHGLSGSNRTQYTMEAFGKDVAAAVTASDAKKVVLVGHSMGGPVAVEAADILGDKVIGIVGVDTFYTPFESPKSEAAINEFVQPFRDDFKQASEKLVRSMFVPTADPELVTSVVDQMSVADPEMGASAMYEILKWSARNKPSALDSYSSKLRNINADPSGDSQSGHQSVTLIPGVGHFIAQAKPHEFNEALRRILLEFQTR